MHEELISQLADRIEHHYYGKYRGTVADNKDPLKLGRLKLRVDSVLTPSEDNTDSSETITDWAMPCVPFGGASERGFFVIPDVGAHVWVEFEEGLLDRPIWTGTFWVSPGNTAQTPTEAQNMADTEEDLEPKRRILKTSSGHYLEFCDISGKESIRIAHENGSLINFDEKGNVMLYSKEGSFLFLSAENEEVSLTHQNGAHIAIKGDQLSLTNKGGSASISMVGEAVQVNAASVHVRSQTVQLCEGADEPVILGNLFAKIFDNHVHTCTIPGTPSSPPVPPMLLSMPFSPVLSQKVKVK